MNREAPKTARVRITLDEMKQRIQERSIVDSCTVCCSSTDRKCGACHVALYCSERCQKADWKFHKIVCSQFANLPLYPDDGECYVLAIHFPHDACSPALCWIDLDWTEDCILPLLRNNADELTSDVWLGGSSLYEDDTERRDIRFWCRDMALSDGSTSNQSIKNATRQLMKEEPIGPLVVGSNNTYHRLHITPRTYRVAIETMLNSGPQIPMLRSNPRDNDLRLYSDGGRWNSTQDMLDELNSDIAKNRAAGKKSSALDWAMSKMSTVDSKYMDASV